VEGSFTDFDSKPEETSYYSLLSFDQRGNYSSPVTISTDSLNDLLSAINPKLKWLTRFLLMINQLWLIILEKFSLLIAGLKIIN
ncbi:MAG: hypothetical protein AAB505_00770, partial [Patescibacteria group bacterium]